MHVFHNISFEAVIEEANTSIVWEQQIVGFIQNQFLPKLEHVLEAWDKKNPNLQCRIEELNLETDLDNFDPKLITNQLLDQFKAQLNQIDVQHPEKTYQLKVKITPKATLFDAFINYLKTGKILKDCSVKKLKNWIKEKTTFSKEEHKQLQQLALKNTFALQRLHQIFYDESYQEVAKLLNIHSVIDTPLQLEKRVVKTMLQQIHKHISIPITEKKIDVWATTLCTSTSIKRYAETLIKLLHTHTNIKTIHIPSIEPLEISIVQAILQHKLSHNITIQLNDLITIQFNKPSTTQKTITKASSNINKDATNIKKQTSNPKPKKIQKEDTTINAIEAKRLKKLLADKGISTHKEHQANQKTDNSKKHKNKNIYPTKKANQIQASQMLFSKEMLSTEKAGLVLVHPFLNILFKELQLVKDKNKITDPKKAAILLHYLATGTTEVSDLELALEKTLLNIPLEDIISKSITLSNDEKQAADALLMVVLQHWNALKNSSINTLRDMYIKREGTIRENEKTVTIKIERLAQDVLLDKLPWGIGMIRLPWKKKFIAIEW